MTVRGTLAVAGAAAAGLGSALILAACGVETTGADREGGSTTLSREGRPAQRGDTPQRLRPAAPRRGVVVVDGSTATSLTRNATAGYSEQGVNVRVGNRGLNAGFAALCRGQADVVDSVRAINQAEKRLCQRYGLTVVQLLIASDAVVAATKNEADVGGDCLTVAQTRRIFRRGSDVDNWRELGFFNLPLSTTGPEADTTTFQFFAQQVLGVETNASLADVRSGYQPFPTDQGVRLKVIRERNIAKARITARALIRARGSRDDRELRKRIDVAQRRAARRVVKDIERENTRRRRLRQSAPRNLERQNLRRVLQAKTGAKRGALGRYRNAQSLRNEALTQRLVLRASRPGPIGLFRFSYYQTFEDQLRPMEIDLGTSRRRNCIFPSTQTITDGSYPLARRLLLYTTTRALRRPEVRSYLLNYVRRAPQLAENRRLVPLEENRRNQQIQIIQNAGRLPESVGGEPRRTTTTRTVTTTTPQGTRTTRTVTTPVRTTTGATRTQTSTAPRVSTTTPAQTPTNP